MKNLYYVNTIPYDYKFTGRIKYRKYIERETEVFFEIEYTNRNITELSFLLHLIGIKRIRYKTTTEREFIKAEYFIETHTDHIVECITECNN